MLLHLKILIIHLWENFLLTNLIRCYFDPVMSMKTLSWTKTFFYRCQSWIFKIMCFEHVRCQFTKIWFSFQIAFSINSQRLEDTQVEYISQKYTFGKYTLKNTLYATSWMGWGSVDWVGRVLPEAKFENKWTSFFKSFLFERPILRYL